MHSSNERRLFTAVKGVKTRQGELFGLKNLFKLRETGSNLTRDLLKRTEIIESGVRMVNYELDAMPKDAIRVFFMHFFKFFIIWISKVSLCVCIVNERIRQFLLFNLML